MNGYYSHIGVSTLTWSQDVGQGQGTKGIALPHPMEAKGDMPVRDKEERMKRWNRTLKEPPNLTS